MKRTHMLAFAAVLLAPAAAAAQPGYGAPPPPPRGQQQGYWSQQPTTLPGGFHDRTGRMAIGFSVGLGGMQIGDSDVTCPSCDYEPIGVEFDFHIGGMLSPRFALLFEVQGNGETVSDDQFGTTSLVQATAMVAGQYWLSPQLWVKGGIGGASLSESYDDGYSEPLNRDLGEGMALMGGVGYELLSARTFSIDLQGRLIAGTYDGIDQQVTSGSIGVGFNWF